MLKYLTFHFEEQENNFHMRFKTRFITGPPPLLISDKYDMPELLSPQSPEPEVDIEPTDPLAATEFIDLREDYDLKASWRLLRPLLAPSLNSASSTSSPPPKFAKLRTTSESHTAVASHSCLTSEPEPAASSTSQPEPDQRELQILVLKKIKELANALDLE